MMGVPVVIDAKRLHSLLSFTRVLHPYFTMVAAGCIVCRSKNIPSLMRLVGSIVSQHLIDEGHG